MAPQFDKALRDLLKAAGCQMMRQGNGSHEIWRNPLTQKNFPVPIGIPSRHTQMRFCGRLAWPRPSR